MRVVLFAHLKDAAGRAELELRVPAPVDADGLWQLLAAKCPALARHRGSTRLARNGAYAGRDDLFADADEVGLIPPVSGG